VGDTLRVHGSAPLRWLAATARTASLPAGVAVLDLRGVEPIVPAELASVKREIEGRRVLFDLGVAALRPEERAEANDVAAGFARLQAGAAKMGVRAGLELVGRADPIGADSTNRALSRSRAEAVLAALVARGVTRDVIRLTAAGTTDPLTAADPGERARINRSVSFMVSLGWDGTGREPAR
jgi:outer membrane protein OmpA-like peptidoglycan-associated protein